MTFDDRQGEDPSSGEPERRTGPGAFGESRREPVFNIPTILMIFLALPLAVYLIETQFLSYEAQNRLLSFFSFRPERYLHPLLDQDLGWLFGPVSYSFLHGSLAHVGFNTVWMAVFATPVARRLSHVSFILFWIFSAAFSAFFFAFSVGFEPTYLIGASGVVSATSGAVCRFAISTSGFAPGQLEHRAPRLTILGALQRPSVLAFAGFWIVSNLLLGLGFGGGPNESPVAWQAHIGGFLFGYLTFGLFDRKQVRP